MRRIAKREYGAGMTQAPLRQCATYWQGVIGGARAQIRLRAGHGSSTLTKTDPLMLKKVDPPVARANASERGQGRAAFFAARRSEPLTPWRGTYAQNWLWARHLAPTAMSA